MLKNLKLENFRSHKKFELELAEITALIGENGIGKTNILEAIGLLSFCRSFRDDDKKNLVHFESAFARVCGDDLEIFIQKEPILIFQSKENGVKKKQSEFIGNLRAVVFSPESLLLVTGGPSVRRRFLDIMISQKNRDYLRSLIKYEKVRTERNSLLKRICEGRAKENELDFWDLELVKEGSIIAENRAKVIEDFNKILGPLYNEIAGDGDKLQIDYPLKYTPETFAALLKENRRYDILSARSNIGPHRDNYSFLLNGHDMANFASRGEIRSAVMAFKIAELQLLTEKNSKPLLLLDDVFSEFDTDRRAHLGKMICQYQTVITTTDKEHLSVELLKKCKVIFLK